MRNHELDVIFKIKLLRGHFIDTLEELHTNYTNLEEENKREREVLLDIIKMEQKHNSQLRNYDRNLVTFNEPSQVKAPKSSNSKIDDSQIEGSSLSIQMDSIDENAAVHSYEINLKNKTIENLHEKLVVLTAQFKMEQSTNAQLQKDFELINQSKQVLLLENKNLK